SSQWWTDLSSTIAGGLTFATILTLLATPALLVLGDNVNAWVKQVTLRFSGVRRATNKKNRATTALPLNEGS
ncbi:MAG: hypothetical protein OSB15_10155, partial [Amylibacter sp.]|nr:hypothetical protein [Amylibacter sp.]